MNDNGFDEQGAHRYLQKKSMDNGINIVEMAYMILEHTALFLGGTNMKFTKMEGLGNDYVYINCFSEKVE